MAKKKTEITKDVAEESKTVKKKSTSTSKGTADKKPAKSADKDVIEKKPKSTKKPKTSEDKETTTKKSTEKEIKASFSENLVIVESPAKAKTIEKYLGSGYKVIASVGHIRDLPKSKLGVDIENDFEPTYINSRDKTDVIKTIQANAKKAKNVFLATDPDREGEAISWHLAHIIGLKSEEIYDKASRVTFNEITKSGILRGMNNPRKLDKKLIDAQQARRILDRIVGYKLSPFLWKKVRRGLSAGRVQSAATRLICDRESEIRAFTPVEYYLIEAIFAMGNSRKTFKSKIIEVDGFKVSQNGDGIKRGDENTTTQNSGEKTKKTKAYILDKDAADKILKRFKQDTAFVISDVKKTEKKKQPSPPFTTSTLQQEASAKLGFTAKRTMKVAQELYEGVDVSGVSGLENYTAANSTTIGLITYMRTDSLRVSDEAQAEAKQFIRECYGEQYLPDSPRVFKSKGNAQDAHEAIRPSVPSISPDILKSASKLTLDQQKLYRLIWSRFTASQAANAVIESVAAIISAENCIFKANGHTVKFDGFMRVYVSETDNKDDEGGSALPILAVGDSPKLVSPIEDNLISQSHSTQPPPRFSEASLIRVLEESGIGRPSTYAPTVSTLLDRHYVELEKKQLVPTILGETVTNILKERFADIVDVNFTAEMETDLDRVAEGSIEWRDVLRGFYGGFEKSLEKAFEGQRVKVPDEPTDEICDKCGKPMVIKVGKFGKFLGCSAFPDCNNTQKLLIPTAGLCPKCGKKMVVRKSKKGRTFYVCEMGKNCGFVTWDIPIADKCTQCERTMFKKGTSGNRVYCAVCDVDEAANTSAAQKTTIASNENA